jgi:hypothetical protein
VGAPALHPTGSRSYALSQKEPARATVRSAAGGALVPMTARWATQAASCDNPTMTGSQGSVVCPGCGLSLRVVEGPSHAYMTCTPACWSRYGDLLAAQYSSRDRMAFHQLIVDSYAVQHPGGQDARAVRSVGIHLMTLCLFLETGADPDLGASLHRRMVQRPVLGWLEPPLVRGQLTVADVPVDGPIASAQRAAYAWASEAWNAWSRHHRTVRMLLMTAGLYVED